MEDLHTMPVEPLGSDEAALSSEEVRSWLTNIPDWTLDETDPVIRLKREFKFANFDSALAFTNRVGALAEQQDHHPAILTEWGRVTVTWWTHELGGLHLNDFISAAKTDGLYHLD
ncbi:MAG: 4a-hydroxytetrahydrobiopterin dehydratase [Anaerolineae bacterium]|nr:4a-hydroxytetrahydrobiopterin dehydratase [Anaerolineae bacterium]